MILKAKILKVEFNAKYNRSLHFTVYIYIYIYIYTSAAWEELRFILSERSDLHMTDSLSIADHTFANHVLMSFSVDKTLLPRYVDLSTRFRELPFRVEIYPF